MHLLITGGAGFIGSNLAAQLGEMPHIQMRIVDKQRRACLKAFKGEFVRGDICDRKTLTRCLDGIDAVVHLAADPRVIDSVINPAFNFAVNVQGTFRLLEAMRAKGVTRLVNASTASAIVGEAQPPIHEDMVPRPLAPYGAAKLSAEAYCSAFAGSYGFKAVSLRFSNVYGPYSFHKGSIVAAFFKRLLQGEPLTVYGDGWQARDFIFVDDLCKGIIQAIKAEVTGLIQLGSGKPVTVNTLIEELRRTVAPRSFEVGYEPRRAGEIHTTWCDITKARRMLGFEPETSLPEGLRRTWRWFLDHSQPP